MGPVVLLYPNGKTASTGDLHGVEVDTVALWTGNDRFVYWRDDDRPLASWAEWFAFQTFEFIPRQMGGRPDKTEEDWRDLVPQLDAEMSE